MQPAKALSLHLSELDQPVISDYDIAMFIFNLLVSGKYKGDPLEPFTNDGNYMKIMEKTIEALLQFGVIDYFKNFSKGKVFKITAKKGYSTGDVLCSIDPFAYLSHLSAMDYHGLTDRIPKILYYTTPPAKDWVKFANDKMQTDSKDNLNEYFKSKLPRLTKIKIHTIEKTPIISYSSIHKGAFKKIEGRSLRVSTSGRTFLDMLRKPDYCGGMRHVIEVCSKFGKEHSRLIISEIDRHGNLIEKTRAGYILDEICKIKDVTIENWAKNVQRGGSRRLDPQSEYSENYSAKWSLSINVDLDENE
jgi:predicted transcriptional regulator of viral defense system